MVADARARSHASTRSGGDFVPIASHGGVNFWTGNNEKADGKIVIAPEGVELPAEWKGKDNLIAISVVAAEKELGRKLKPSEVSSFWIHKALSWMASHPLDAARLYLRKIYYFWAGCEYTNNEDVYSFRHYSRLLSLLLLPLGPVYLPGALVMPFALYGLIVRRREWKRAFPLVAFLVVYMVTVVAFFVSSCHRLPVVPICALFAAAALASILETKPWSRGGPALTRGAAFTALLCLLAVNPGARPAATIQKFHTFEAVAWSERGAEAADAGRNEEAMADLNRALRVRPDDGALHYRLGLLLGKAGRFPEAETHLRQALAASPGDPTINVNLALNCYYQGKLEEARSYLLQAQQAGGRIDPRIVQLLQGGGR